MIERQEQGKPDKHERHIEIKVNTKPVVVEEKELSGLQIKQAAIAQNVTIKVDFVLFQDLSNGQQEIVKDSQIVKLHNHMQFDAITNDDNS